VRFQKLMWRNMMRSSKSQKVSILHYNIDCLGYLSSRYQFFLNANYAPRDFSVKGHKYFRCHITQTFRLFLIKIKNAILLRRPSLSFNLYDRLFIIQSLRPYWLAVLLDFILFQLLLSFYLFVVVVETRHSTTTFSLSF
jgi:hypothetical protein